MGTLFLYRVDAPNSCRDVDHSCLCDWEVAHTWSAWAAHIHPTNHNQTRYPSRDPTGWTERHPALSAMTEQTAPPFSLERFENLVAGTESKGHQASYFLPNVFRRQ